jgi:putative nucleotidyltransferase with HDIG domain
VKSTQTQAEIEEQLAAQLLDLGDEPSEISAPVPSVTFKKELKKATKIKDRARLVIGSSLEDVRMGQQVALGPVKEVIHDIIESVHRNPDAILSLSMLKKRDDYTFMHSVNFGVLIISLCHNMKMKPDDIAAVGLGGMLHDIGKMRIPSKILNKPGALTSKELLQVRRHVEQGARILERTPGIQQTSIQVASLHHERLDGSGYPNALKGDEINLIGRIAAIIDVYDAITSTSCYRKSLDPHLVLKKMMGFRGRLVDDELLQTFINCIGIYPIGSLVKLENGLIGVVIRSNPGSLLHPVINVIIDSKKKKRIKPEEFDLLAYKGDKKSGYKIKKLESIKEWKVDPRKFMPIPDSFF